jgi:hypothetical protein
MDASAALYAIKNPALRARSKHIDVKIKWLLMHYLKCFIFIHVRTEDMTADLLTKPSALRVWVELIGHLMGVDIRGSVQLQLAQGGLRTLYFPSDRDCWSSQEMITFLAKERIKRCQDWNQLLLD